MTQLVNKASSWRTLRRKVVVGASSLALVAGMGVALAPAANAAQTPPTVKVDAPAQIANDGSTASTLKVTIDNSQTGNAAVNPLYGAITVTLPEGLACTAIMSVSTGGTIAFTQTNVGDAGPKAGSVVLAADAAPAAQNVCKGTFTVISSGTNSTTAGTDNQYKAGDKGTSAVAIKVNGGGTTFTPGATGNVKFEVSLNDGGAAFTSASGTSALIAPIGPGVVSGTYAKPIIGAKYSQQVVDPLGLPAGAVKIAWVKLNANGTYNSSGDVASLADITAATSAVNTFAYDGATGKINSSAAVKFDGSLEDVYFTVIVSSGSVTFTGVGAPNWSGKTAAIDPNSGDIASAPFQLGATFTDVPVDYAFADEIYELAGPGVIEGNTDGSFAPTADVTRAQFAAFVFRITGGTANPSTGICTGGSSTFNDVSNTSPFCQAINWMAAQGLSTGYADGGYHPAAPITRQTAAAFLNRLSDTSLTVAGNSGFTPASPQGEAEFSDVDASNPFADDIAWAAGNKITTGYTDGTFRPTINVSRQVAAAFLSRLAALY